MTGIEPALLEYGLLGIIVLALGWAWVKERERANAAIDARIEDLKDHSKQLADEGAANRAVLDGIQRALEARRDA